MFYLLKSTYKRNIVGDVLIDLNQVESFVCGKKKFEDTENEVYAVRVNLKSNDDFKASFKTLDELKKVIKEMLGDKVSDKDLDDLQPACKD